MNLFSRTERMTRVAGSILYRRHRLVFLLALLIAFLTVSGKTTNPPAQGNTVISPACSEGCGSISDPAKKAACVAREVLCQTKLTSYQTYMAQLGAGVALHRLPALYVELLQPHFKGADLSGWRFGFGDRQPSNNATTDCSKTFFNSPSFVGLLTSGQLESDTDFNWLLHELRHHGHCAQVGSRDAYAKMWFGNLDIALLQGPTIDWMAIHDRMPMESDADGAARRVLGNIAKHRDRRGRMVLPLSVDLLAGNQANPVSFTVYSGLTQLVIARENTGLSELDFEWSIKPPGSTTFGATFHSPDAARLSWTPNSLGTSTIKVRVKQIGATLAAAEKTLAVTVVTPPPAAPINLNSPATTHQSIQLNWQDQANNEAGFRIDRLVNGSFVLVGTASANTGNYQHTGLNSSTQYFYRVCAVNSTGEGCSTTLQVSTKTPPQLAPPTHLKVDTLTATAVKITWQDNASGESAYRVERLSGSWQPSGITAENATNLTMSGLTPNTSYTFRVCALSGSNSACSQTMNVTTKPN